MKPPTGPSDRDLAGELLELDLDRVRDQLGTDPGEALRDFVWPGRAYVPSQVAALVGPPGQGADAEATKAAFAAAGEGGRRAIDKVSRKGEDVNFDAFERDGAEAIIELWKRPAILIQDGKFFSPPEDWAQLEERRAQIESVIPSVGRIELEGHPVYSWVGTGFLAAPGVVITNRHVAKHFAEPTTNGRWTFEPGVKARIDFGEELNASNPREFSLKEVLGVSQKYDMALLSAARRGKAGKLPAPLKLTSRQIVRKGREVYVVGFPALDSHTGDPGAMARIFQGIYDIKRLQPGVVRNVDSRRRLFAHDSSTLGGNSGSCVVDLKTNAVIGLHFKGFERIANIAVNLTRLSEDPLLRDAEIEFE